MTDERIIFDEILALISRYRPNRFGMVRPMRLNFNSDLCSEGFVLDDVVWASRQLADAHGVKIHTHEFDRLPATMGDWIEILAFFIYPSPLEKTLIEVTNPEVHAIDATKLQPFVVADLNQLDSKTRSKIENGARCVWTKCNHSIFECTIQLTFVGKDSKYYVLYLGLLFTTTVVMANFTNEYWTVITTYGKRTWDNQGMLNVEKASNKLPLFVKIFTSEQSLGKSTFVHENGQVYVATQVSDDSLSDEKSIYNMLGSFLTMSQALYNEIKTSGAGKYNFVEDVLRTLGLFLRLQLC